MTRLVLFLSIAILPLNLWGQFAPPAGEPGSTAVPADSPFFTAWGSVADITLGPLDLSNPDAGIVTAGQLENAFGPADGITLSLGDGGQITYYFDPPIIDSPGWDFAIFENSFNNTFLELAFVEVSSDGENFVRFPATSLTPTKIQVDAFGSIDATKVNNLAGKYKGNYGTPFDLSELEEDINLNISNISHIRLIDVVGSIDPEWGQADHLGNLINDPFPTPFESAGFDIDAIGVLEGLMSNAEAVTPADIQAKIFPNPALRAAPIHLKLSAPAMVQIWSSNGKSVFQKEIKKVTNTVTFSINTPGIYFVDLRYFAQNKAARIFLIIQ